MHYGILNSLGFRCHFPQRTCLVIPNINVIANTLNCLLCKAIFSLYRLPLQINIAIIGQIVHDNNTIL
ncbi:hypothetical protein ACJX0J_031565, partial [Zea mays]